MDYVFYLYISDVYLQFWEKSILIWVMNFVIKSIRKGIKILEKCWFSFSIMVFKMKFLFIFFFQGKVVWFTIYKQPDPVTVELFLKLCIPQRYVHELEGYWKIFACVGVKNLLISKTLNFKAVFAKKIKLSKVCIQISV